LHINIDFCAPGEIPAHFLEKVLDLHKKCGRIYKDIETQYEKEAVIPLFSEKGTVEALWDGKLRATFVRPGMTGTGAPDTEQLEMLSLQRSRVVPRDIRPCVWRAAFLFCIFFVEVSSNEQS